MDGLRENMGYYCYQFNTELYGKSESITFYFRVWKVNTMKKLWNC